MLRKAAIAILGGMFCMMFLHLLIPHHHHAQVGEVAHMVSHECEDGHEHQHHAVDLFFSFLYHIDEVEPFSLNVFDEDGAFAWLGFYAVEQNGESSLDATAYAEKAKPPPNDRSESIWQVDCHGLRGPPLV